MSTEQRPPITHELKCHPGPFQALKDGTKPFEWRKDDRDYRVGDTLRLCEWLPGETEYVVMAGQVVRQTIGFTGEEIDRTVTYIIREGFGIPEGYCIMGLALPQQDVGAGRSVPSPVGQEQQPLFTEAQVKAMLKDILFHIADYGYVHDKFKEQSAKHGITLP